MPEVMLLIAHRWNRFWSRQPRDLARNFQTLFFYYRLLHKLFGLLPKRGGLRMKG
jgi:hypothetical protein